MSDPEAGNTEPAGLARSFDTLFSGGSVPPEVGPHDVGPEATDPPAEIIPETPSVAEPEAEEISAVAEPEAEETSENDAPAEPGIDEVPEGESTSDEPVVGVPAVEDASLQDEPVLEAESATEPEEADESAFSDEDAEFVPTDLDLAVDAYLEGDQGKVREIETLAAELLATKEIDPIARAVARLTLAAGDPPDTSIYAVAESIMSPVVLGRLTRHMGTERREGRRDEYYAVCRTIGDDMATAIRDDLADATDQLARRIFCEALMQMGEPGRNVIEEMAVDENRFLVKNAVVMLGDMGGARAVELVTSALANPDALVRREALRSLAKLGDPESGQYVIGLLDDVDAKVRRAAAVAVGELKVERSLKQLLSMLEAGLDPDDSLPVIRALGQIGDPGAVASIEKHAVRSIFSKPRADVRIAAYRALNQIGTPHARQLLKSAVNDKDEGVKSAVRKILRPD